MGQEETKKQSHVNLVEGYLFQSPAESKRALEEQKYLDKIKMKMNPEHTEELYKIYLKLTGKGYFVTPVGISFLHDLRNFLIEQGCDLEQNPIPVLTHTKLAAEEDSRLRRKNEMLLSKQDQMSKELKKLEALRMKLTIAVVALAVTVVGMLFIVVTNDNVGYFNAEQKVLDKYSYWEEQLQEKEQELLQWEQELSEQSK